MTTLTLEDGKIPLNLRRFLNKAANTGLPEPLLSDSSDDIQFVWSVSDNRIAATSIDEATNILTLSDDNNAFEGFTFTWEQDGQQISEDWFITPIQEMNIQNSLEDPAPEPNRSDWAARQDLIDEIWGTDDDYDEQPFTIPEFIEYFAPIILKCENTVSHYLQKNEQHWMPILSSGNVKAIKLTDDDRLVAVKYNNTEVDFQNLTIGQFVSITDEVLYKSTQNTQ